MGNVADAALHELLDIAAEPRDLIGFRRSALDWCDRHFGADQLAVGGPGDLQLTEHATSSREVCDVSCHMWREIGRYEHTLSALLGAAQASGRAVQAGDVIDVGAREHRRFIGEILEPVKTRLLAVVPLCLGGSVLGMLALGRARGASGFSVDQLGLLGRAAQVIALGDAVRQAPSTAGACFTTAARPQPMESLRKLVPAHEPLTAREREVVELVTMGLTNAQVALALGTSPNTVRKQLVAIFRKLDVGSRAELVRVALTEAPAARPAQRAQA